MPKFRSGNSSIYYEVRGEGAPLLFLSGLACDSSTWLGVVAKFSEFFKTIIFDNRGTGRSGGMPRPRTIGSMADDAVSLLEHLKIKKAHLIGHSMGGYIAQHVAIHYPERTNKLILEGTAPVSSKRNNGLFAEFYKKLRGNKDLERWIREWTFWLFSPKVFEDGSFVEIFVKKSLEYPYPVRASAIKAQIEAISSFDVTAKLGEIKAKTLVMSGENDILITRKESEVLVKNIPKCNFKLLEGAAHAMHIEKQKLFTDVALGFLAS